MKLYHKTHYYLIIMNTYLFDLFFKFKKLQLKSQLVKHRQSQTAYYSLIQTQGFPPIGSTVGGRVILFLGRSYLDEDMTRVMNIITMTYLNMAQVILHPTISTFVPEELFSTNYKRNTLKPRQLCISILISALDLFAMNN